MHCVTQADGYYSQCIDCAQASFGTQCQYWSAAILIAAEATCGIPTCPGKCPSGKDSECASGETCVVQADESYNQCIDCTAKLFAEECYYWTPDFLLAAEAKCQEDCTGRCPNHTDAECPAGQQCAVQADGYFDQCISCDATAFQNECKYWSEGICENAQDICHTPCKVPCTDRAAGAVNATEAA
jgi:hypothetical protein